MTENKSPYSDTEFPPEYREKWEAFLEDLGIIATKHFGEDDRAHVVLGAQWGDMGKDDTGDLLPCIVTSDLDICLVGQALGDMVEYVHKEHRLYHGESVDDDEDPPISEVIVSVPSGQTEADVPAEVKAMAEDMAASLGVPVVYIGSADLDDPEAFPQNEG